MGKKIAELRETRPNKRVRLMVEDEAAFGRINVPKYCWCPPGIRPSVPCQRVREYVNVYGAADPLTGESFFLIFPCNNTHCMNLFLERLGQDTPTT